MDFSQPRSPVDSAANDAELVRLQGVKKIYRVGSSRVNALGGVDLTIDQGGFWAIMGPSGSGKSTLLNLLGCMDRPSHGAYTFAGQDVGRLDDDALSELRLKKIGFIFQNFNLIKQLTVRENIELPLYYLGWSAQDSMERASDLADRVGLGGRLAHRPSELSGGEQQRVAIARALANDPQMLLADEPTGNLDSATSTDIMEILSGLHKQSRTIVLVTHETDIAAYAACQLHMRDGVVDRIEDMSR